MCLFALVSNRLCQCLVYKCGLTIFESECLELTLKQYEVLVLQY